MARTDSDSAPKYQQVYRRAGARDPGRPLEGRRPPAQRGRPRAASSGRRGSPSAARCGTSSSPGSWSGAPGSGTYVKRPRPPAARPLVRPADPRPRRDRDLRADLPGHDGLAARARARPRLGQRRAAPARSKEERAWDLCRQYIDRKVSGVFFAPLELDAGQGRGQPPHRAGPRRRAHPGRPPRSDGRSPIPSAATTTSSASTTAAPATSSPSTSCGWAPAASRSSASPTPPRPSTRAPPATARRCIAWDAPFEPRARAPPRSRRTPAAVRALMERRAPTPSSAPTTGRRRA